jgi:HK97 gp10 family phage protein
MAITAVLTGDKTINRRLAKLTGPEAKNIIRKSARPALKPILAAARANAPTDKGLLRKSVKIRAMKRSRSRVGATVSSGSKTSAYAGKAWYGGPIEYGYTRRDGREMPAVRFMKRAVDAKREQSIRIYRESIRKMIRDLGTKG